MKIQENTGEKVFYLTVLNVLSAWCVVMLHCNGIFGQGRKEDCG